jgi:RNA polymerase sigma-70 factor (ECF subfamily)
MTMTRRHDTFERLYAHHAGPLLAFLIYRTGDRALAEDILADTFERVLTARRPFDSRRASEKTWLYTIALNRLRDHGRRQGAESRAVERVGALAVGSGSPAGEQAIIDRDLLQRGLEGLSEQERVVVALRYGADMTVPQIAKLLGEGLTMVEGRLYRALRKLRQDLHPT